MTFIFVRDSQEATNYYLKSTWYLIILLQRGAKTATWCKSTMQPELRTYSSRHVKRLTWWVWSRSARSGTVAPRTGQRSRSTASCPPWSRSTSWPSRARILCPQREGSYQQRRRETRCLKIKRYKWFIKNWNRQWTEQAGLHLITRAFGESGKYTKGKQQTDSK